MEDYLYLDDYINLYSKKYNKIIIIKPYKGTLKYGHIINKEKFIKKMNQVIDEYHINNNIFNNNINVIINNSFSIIDKEIIKELLLLLNYKKVNFIQEINYLNINKNKIYINYNETYFYIYNINNIGNIDIHIYVNNKINRSLIIEILNLLNKNKIFIFGKNYLELVNLLNKTSYEYYFFEESKNLLINLILKNV